MTPTQAYASYAEGCAFADVGNCIYGAGCGPQRVLLTAGGATVRKHTNTSAPLWNVSTVASTADAAAVKAEAVDAWYLAQPESPAPTLTCGNHSSTVTITSVITTSNTALPALYEIQWAVAPTADAPSPPRVAWRGSQTSALPSVTVTDLAPSSSYILRARFTMASEVVGWTPWSRSVLCGTATASRWAPTNLTRVAPPTTTATSKLTSTSIPGSVTITWDPPPPPPRGIPPYLFKLEWSVASDASGAPYDRGHTAETRATTYTLTGPPGQLLTVAVTAVTQDGTGTSPYVSFRTGAAAQSTTRFISMIRVSERQGANASEIDFLTNHDAGDAVGDSAVRDVVLFLLSVCLYTTVVVVLTYIRIGCTILKNLKFVLTLLSVRNPLQFLTAMGTGGKFVEDFASATLAQYCVEVDTDGQPMVGRREQRD